jgi:hypothetical protein
MPSIAILGLCWCLLPVVTAQESPADRWITQLKEAVPEAQATARAKLLELGTAAALPLAAQLEHAGDDHAVACLEVLNDLGPLASAAAPVLIGRLRKDPPDRRRKRALRMLLTLAELVPHHECPEPLTDFERLQLAAELGLTRVDCSFALWRLRQRSTLAPGQDLETLLKDVAGHDSGAVEVAIERLSVHGGRAAVALPVLRGLLDRPEPRFLLTERRVPLHRKAALAILRIAPGGAEAAVARALLVGTWTPLVTIEPEMPERLRVRIDEVRNELRRSEPSKRCAAGDNLVALGAAAARPVAAMLSTDETDETIQAALDVLRRLGKQAASASPAIADALPALHARHAAAVLRTLATTLPWSRDMFVEPVITKSAGRFVIQGQASVGTFDVAFLTEFDAAQSELQVALAVPVDAAPDALAALLADPLVVKRRRALQVIAARGQECAPLLPALAAMLETAQPTQHVSEWIDERRSRSRQVDRSDLVQRLAADAILAVAPPEHALVAVARARLGKPAAE